MEVFRILKAGTRFATQEHENILNYLAASFSGDDEKIEQKGNASQENNLRWKLVVVKHRMNTDPNNFNLPYMPTIN